MQEKLEKWVNVTEEKSEKRILFQTSRAGQHSHSRSRKGSCERERLSAGGRGASVRNNICGACVSVGSSVAERNGRNSLLAPMCAEGEREGGDAAAR